MTEYEQTVSSSAFKDRTTGLVAFGIVQILFGGLCALAVPLIVLAMIASSVHEDSPGAAMSVRTMIPGILVYIVLAVWFIWMGIGSIKTRRWARALVLVSSWIWLISGVMGVIAVLLFMPDMYGRMAEAGEIPPKMAVIMKYVMTGFLMVFYVIIPGLFVLFYGGKNVKATCEFRDPHVRWTDKCPLPVLAVSLIFGLWAVSLIFVGLYGWVIPFFGSILSGISGAGVAIVFMLLSAYVARGMYKLNIKAWWCSVLLMVVWGLSTGITFSRMTMLEFYEKTNIPEQQIEAMSSHSMLEKFPMAALTGLWAIGFLGYLLYTKRYFSSPSNDESGSRGGEI